MEEIRYIEEEEFNDFIVEQKRTVLVCFSATWCNPCKMLKPILQSVKEEVGTDVDIFSVDVDNSFDLAKSYGVLSVPTLILFKDGLEHKRVIGLKSKDFIVEMLKD